ncbi:MAG: ABC transporter permease [Mogibacterium sp.]|nr:ABC transporter permease [Mogibacterium sp.]
MKSDLGWFWAIAKPLFYIMMFYFAISTGFRNARDIEGSVCPYFIWLASGIVPWQYISDLLVGGANCFNRYKSIIKGTKYPVSAIPTIPVISKLLIHCIMVVILMLIAVLMGVKPSIYWLQLPIYMLLTIIFVYVWVMMTGLMNVMSADILEFIKTIRTAFFWLSGILFNSRGKKSLFFTLNPIRFIAEGYRNVFAYHVWIWEQKRLLFNYCVVMLIMTFVTFLLYKRMAKRMPEFV